MEQRLIQAGFKKLNSEAYHHPERGLLFRSERNHRWYLRATDGRVKYMARTLREAIQALLGD